MAPQSQHTRTAEITLDKRGFIRFSVLPDAVIDAEDALDNFLVIKTLSGGKKMLKLVDVRGKWKITKAAKEVSKKNVSPDNTIARAYVIDSFITKFLLSFFRSLNAQVVPQEFFTNESEAIKWLLAFKNK